MSKDLENIAIIEKKIGITFKRYLGYSFFRGDANEIYLLEKGKNIIWLNLRNRGLSDISFLELLPNLTQINLSGNSIADISILKSLPNLIKLYLNSNKISDISVLKYLPNLSKLYLSYNNITDISVLDNLKKLWSVNLNSNKISELPKGLLSLKLEIKYEKGYEFPDNAITVYDNPIQTPPLEIIKNGNAAIKAYFKSLEESEDKASIKVKILPVGDSSSDKTDLENIAIIEQKIGRKLKRYYGSSFFGHDASGTYLLDEHKNVVGLNLFNCHIPVISFLELLPNLIQLDLSGNQIKGFSVLKYLPKLTQLGLRGKIITDISAFLEIVKQGNADIKAYFKSLEDNKKKSTDLENIASIEQKIGRKLKQCKGLNSFYYDAYPKYLLDKNKNIVGLNLLGCDLSNISFLKLLPKLNQLYLRNNNITDISVLEFLPNITQLLLGKNNITDISVLKFLSNLTLLDLRWNKITDISILQNLPNLTKVYLNSNNISDISVLKFLPNLTRLDLSLNKITDISVLENLKNLRYINLNDNNISELPKGLLSLNLEITYNFEHKFSDNAITVYGNPIQTPPLEIVKQGNAAIKAYFKSLEEREEKALVEVKVSQIGDSDSGKTSEFIERTNKITDDSEARQISDEELIKRIKKSDKVAKTKQVTTTVYIRNEYVSEFAKRKSNGFCQLCENSAPFNDSKGKPYLESHHVIWLSRGGDDSVENVIALCPNCHAKIHELDIESDVEKLKRKAMENSKV